MTRPLRVLLRTSPAQSDPWREALQAALPEATITAWPDVIADPDYVAVWKPEAELFASIAAPKAIFNLGAGVDALLRLPSLPRGVPIIRLEDAGMAQQMREYVTLAVLAAQRQRDAYEAQQRGRIWQALPPIPASEFTVGMLGLGVLGRACLDALAPFGFPRLGWSRELRTVDGVETYAGAEGLRAMLGRSRALVCLLPSTPDTVGLLDATHLAMLPRGAHVINVARGELVVDEHLLALLDSGHLGGATLDVFREEPLP
ncbi:MAG TPA: glyoxylate/hydroxypyruvate reductase A, partial [Casimicrobiaceae bacterium]|nr:glyoxylate/hydroxypyruvate reductase A [Casimicrobiaceae bacterium]